MGRKAKASATAGIGDRARRARSQLLILAAAALAIGTTFLFGVATANAVPPDLTIDTPTNVTMTSVDVSGTVNPKEQPTNWFFELSIDGGVSWEPTAASGVFGLAGENTPQSTGVQTISNLVPGKTYLVRLTGYGGFTDFGATPEPNPSFTTITTAPEIEGISGTGSATEIEFRGKVNSGGLATTYFFEYGPTAAYGSRTSTRTIGAGLTPVAVSGAVQNLTPPTTLHFRLVASNSNGTVASADGVASTGAVESEDLSCPNAAVRTQQGAARLPECRAYEIVNPPSLDVGEVNRVSAISDDGRHVSYLSVIPGNSSLGGAVTSTAVATRTPNGWTHTDANIFSPGGVFNNAESATPLAFSQDFSKVLMYTNVPGDPRDHTYLQDAYRVDVGTGQSVWMNAWADTEPERLFGATPDLSSVLLRLADGTSPGLYKTSGATAELVSVDESGVPINRPIDVFPAGGASQRGYLTEDGRVVSPWLEHGGNHAVSDDAMVIYFFALNGGNPTRLYVRDFRADPPVTYLINQSRRAGDVGTVYSGGFISASRDGSVAYFVSAGQLTDSATPGGGIYRFSLADQSLTQITPDAGDPVGLNLAGAIASDDGSHIYFTSTSALAGAAVAGAENAYVWTQAEGVRFIAAVNGGDKFVRSSRNGRYALMESTASIDGATNDGHVAIYEYDFAAASTTCVSCRAGGALSEGEAMLRFEPPGFPTNGIIHPRNITDDGKVFFMTHDRLVGADQTPALDVYVYAAGSTKLLTSGSGDTDSFLGDNSDDGRSAFVITRSALVGADRDAHEFDVYDVRAGGGFLESEAIATPCSGDGCQGLPTPVPGTTTPGSGEIAGPGNQKAKHGKAKKHHKKKHHKKKKQRKHHHKKAGKKDAHKRPTGRDGRNGR